MLPDVYGIHVTPLLFPENQRTYVTMESDLCTVLHNKHD